MEELLALGLPTVIGGIQGGVEAARSGQNPLQVLGATGLGALTGLGLGKFSRFAGEAFAGGLAGRAQQNLMKAGFTGLQTQAMMPSILAKAGQAGQAATYGTQALLGGLPGQVGAGVTGTVGNVARGVTGGGDSSGGGGLINTAGGMIGTQQNWQRNEQLQKAGLTQPSFQGPAAPNIDPDIQRGFSYVNPVGSTQQAIAVSQELQRLALQNANLMQNYNTQVADTMKQRDSQRQAAMASLKTQLGTQQGLILGGQQYGAQLANQALADTGAIARQTYLY